MSSERDINRLAALVDGPVEVAPPGADLAARLVETRRTAIRLADQVRTALMGARGGANNVDSGAIDLKPAIKLHLREVAIAQRITWAPGRELDD